MGKTKLRRRHPKQPLGMLSALLAGSMTTLIGVFSGLEPFVILIRAAASSLALGLTVSLGMSIIRVANIPSETKANR